MTDWGVLLLALLAALPGLLAIWVQRKRRASETRKTDIEAAGELTESALVILVPMKDRIRELETTVLELSKRIDHQDAAIAELLRENGLLRAGASRLENQVNGLGHVPVFTLRELRRRADKGS